MNKAIHILVAVFLLAGLSSCEDLKFGDAFLEMPAGNEDNIDVLFSSKENAEQALVSAYTTLPDIQKGKLNSQEMLESLTDLNNSTMGYGPLRNFYYPGQLTSATLIGQMRYNYTNGGWPGIRASWIFIENVDRVPDMTQAEKDMRKAEAKIIIAIHYLDMLRAYGGVPWIGKSYDPGDEMSNLPRMTVAETVSKIAGLLDEAANTPSLPWTVDAVDDGRMTKAAAMALKVRLLLFAASPLFNDDAPYMAGAAADQHLVWYGNKDMQRWQDVVDASEDFLEELAAQGGYALVNTGNPRTDFRSAYFDRGNGEVLISTRKRSTYPGGIWGDGTFIWAMCQYGIGNTTLDYVDMFQMTTGEDFDWNNPEHAAHPFFDASGAPVRDPRLYETVLVNGDDYQGRKAALWIGGQDRPDGAREKKWTASGFCMRKFRQDITSAAKKFYSFPYLRLPEVYLSYAEALNELDRTSESYPYVNMIRERVGMPPLPAGLTKEQMREAILRERALEFGYEEVRFFDLIRWKRDDIFRKKLRGLDITSADNGKTLSYAAFDLPNSRAWQGDNWDPKWYLTPLPIDEINKKYGLIQNPGW